MSVDPEKLGKNYYNCLPQSSVTGSAVHRGT